LTLHTVEHSSELPATAETAYAWHARPGAFERLAPPWESVRVVERSGTLEQGQVVLDVPVGPLRRRWVARHHDGIPGRQFVDEQAEGPFTRWVHTHRFEPIPPERCRLVDQIRYELPFGAAGELAAGAVARRLTRTFRYRHSVLGEDLATPARYGGPAPRTIAVTGATGLVGRALLPFLTTQGHQVRRVIRGWPGPDDIAWDPSAGRLDPAALEGVDGVIHLAGESIAAGRWTAKKRRRILESRTAGTTLLAQTLGRLARPPRVLISASAIGIYGERGDELVTERTGLRAGGRFFVEQVGHAWEAATQPAERAGIRVVRARMGIILTPAGGALAAMLPPFLAGLGGRMGSGRQYMSWISMDDIVGALYHLLLTDTLRGPVNLTAPAPATNEEFTQTLGRVLRRPTRFPVPAVALRLVAGDMADELLLASSRVIPERLSATGYRFRHGGLEPALRHVLGR
jgi:uncharacterized protein (TIGR01777 family)